MLPAALVEYLRQRAELVECVREQAKATLEPDTDWTHEYRVLPASLPESSWLIC